MLLFFEVSCFKLSNLLREIDLANISFVGKLFRVSCIFVLVLSRTISKTVAGEEFVNSPCQKRSPIGPWFIDMSIGGHILGVQGFRDLPGPGVQLLGGQRYVYTQRGQADLRKIIETHRFDFVA